MSIFVVRIATGEMGCLRGTVSRAATGETLAFAEGESLVALLQQWTALEGVPGVPVDPPAGPERAEPSTAMGTRPASSTEGPSTRGPDASSTTTR